MATSHTPSDNTWLDLEQTICKDIQISDLPFCSQSVKKHPSFKAPTISSSLTAWWKFYYITGSAVAPSIRTPIWNNPDFIANKKTIRA